jgi:hypothetical protein
VRTHGEIESPSAYRRFGRKDFQSTRSRESARLDQDRSLVGTRGRDPGHRGSPDEEVVHRSLAHRDIRDPGDKLSMHFGIAKLETPMSGGQLSAHQRRRIVPP